MFPLKETVLTPYDRGNETQKCTLEVACLIRQEGDPHGAPCGPEDRPERGEPSETAGGEGTDPEPAAPSQPKAPSGSGSCSCVLSLKEPLELGENEDCSQAVAPCSCWDGVAEHPPLETPVCGSCSDDGSAQAACPHGSRDRCPELCGRGKRGGGAESEAGRGGGEAEGRSDCSLQPERHSTDSTAKAALPLVSDCEQGLSLHLSTGDITQGQELEGHTVAAGE